MMLLRDLRRRPAGALRRPPVTSAGRRGRVVPHSICEKRFLDVNRTRHEMFLRGNDVGNPVLLSYTADCLSTSSPSGPTALEDCFTVA